MRRTSGFTVIELIVVIVVLAIIGTLIYTRRDNSSAIFNDAKRKTAINAMYYNLEEVYYKQHGNYPAEISSGNLPAMDPALFTDPDGHKLDDASSNYRYTATDCNGDKCGHYTLRADLQREADYVKSSRH